jgi:photosystem II stability/assembly factor-like uncharacterized protein
MAPSLRWVLLALCPCTAAPACTARTTAPPRAARPAAPTPGAQQWWQALLAAPLPQLPAPEYLRAESAFAALSPPNALSVLSRWEQITTAPLDTQVSPTPNWNPAAGLVRDLAIPRDRPARLYLASERGGLFLSDDRGETWRSLSDRLPTQTFQALATPPGQPDTLIAGSGDGTVPGQGLFVTTDGGRSFTQRAADRFFRHSIRRLLFHGGDLYAAVSTGAGCGTNVPCDQRGLHRSRDLGRTWELLLAGDVTDIEIDGQGQGAPPRLYVVSSQRALRSIDGGATFQAMAGLPTPQSSPAANSIALALSPSDPQVLYAGVGMSQPTTNPARIYRSLDRGTTWTLLPDTPDYCTSQCTYDNEVAVDPQDPDTVYFGGSLCAVWQTQNGRADTPTFQAVSLPGGRCDLKAQPGVWTSGYVHPDVHHISFAPDDPAQVYVGHDGGLSRSADRGATWRQLNQGRGSLLLYRFCMDPQDARRVYAGAQDNGTLRLSGTSWLSIGTGDGGACVVHPKDPKSVLVSTQNATVYRTTDRFATRPRQAFSGSQADSRAPFVTVMAADPHDPLGVYVGTYRLWRTPDFGQTFTLFSSADLGASTSDTLAVIAPSPRTPGLIYTGSSQGRINRTTDQGQSFTVISKDPLPGRTLSGLAVAPDDDRVVYAVYGGFSTSTPTRPGHVFRTEDGGETWALRDLPIDVPATSVLALSRDRVFVGTAFGVLGSEDGGRTWGQAGRELPNVPVTQLAYLRETDSLYAGTYGRSLWALPLSGALGEIQPVPAPPLPDMAEPPPPPRTGGGCSVTRF